MVTWSVLSGAGSYCQLVSKARGLVSLFTICPFESVLREVVGGLIDAGPLLDELHQYVVGQAARAEAEPLFREPCLAEGLAVHYLVLLREAHGEAWLTKEWFRFGASSI